MSNRPGYARSHYEQGKLNRPKQVWYCPDGSPVPKEHIKGAIPRKVAYASN